VWLHVRPENEPEKNWSEPIFLGLRTDQKKIFALVRPMPFFERSSFKLRCETVIGIVLCYSHRTWCLLYCLYKINNGIHIYQFTCLNLCTSASGCGCGFGFEQNIGGSTDLAKKRHGSADTHTSVVMPVTVIVCLSSLANISWRMFRLPEHLRRGSVKQPWSFRKGRLGCIWKKRPSANNTTLRSRCGISALKWSPVPVPVCAWCSFSS